MALERGAEAADERAIADRHHYGRDLGQGAGDLGADGGGAGDDLGIRAVLDEDGSRGQALGEHDFLGRVEIAAQILQLGAEAADERDLALVAALGHAHGERQAELVAGVGHGGAVVTGRGGEHTAGLTVADEVIDQGQRAADFEGADGVAEFALDVRFDAEQCAQDIGADQRCRIEMAGE